MSPLPAQTQAPPPGADPAAAGAGVLERCRDLCRRQPGSVVFPDCLDPRVLEAARRLQAEGLARPVLVASPFALRDKLRRAGLGGRGVFTVVDPASPGLLQENLDTYRELRERKGRPLEEEKARRAVLCPLLAAALMVRRGQVEVGVAGNLSPTAAVLRAGLEVLPRRQGVKTISSFFLMLSPDGKRRFVFADCAVVPEPDAENLADIAVSAAEVARNLLGQEPRVALLSFSTKGSARHPRAELVRRAVELIRRQAPDIMVDGELQFDAAAIPDVAALKAPGSILAGQANVLVFPSLEAGNIAYKMVQRLAGYTAVGPFIQGFAGGWHDLSRGCSARDIVEVSVIGLCMQRGNLLI